MRTRSLALPAVALLLALPAVASAQVPDPVEALKRMMEQGVDRLVQGAGERYKLDDGQKEQLRSLLGEKTKEFLDGHADELKSLSEKVQALREKGAEAKLTEWAEVLESARPLMESARKNVEKTGDIFRDKVLDDEQKKLFEQDREAGRNMFERMQRGGFGGGGAGGFGNNPALRFSGRGFEEQSWEQWLRTTARRVEMNEEQQSKAKEFLELAKKAAADYRKAKEEDYKRMAAAFAELRRTPDAEKRKALEKEGGELTKPIDEIGTKWKADVTNLLTPEQKKKLEAAEPKAAPKVNL